MQLSLFKESQDYFKYINAAQAKALNNLVFLGYEINKTKKLDYGYIEAELRLHNVDIVGDWYETETHWITLTFNRFGDVTHKRDEIKNTDRWLICPKSDPLYKLRLLAAVQNLHRKAYAHLE
ncbi:MAG: hypothetical protein HC799_19040 [Limnothrix sp. RL_2_0]|nr:hypothetical protein [Limnothrix sp. RL_2_0]